MEQKQVIHCIFDLLTTGRTYTHVLTIRMIKFPVQERALRAMERALGGNRGAQGKAIERPAQAFAVQLSKAAYGMDDMRPLQGPSCR